MENGLSEAYERPNLRTNSWNLNVDPSTVWRTVRKFEEDGTVEAGKHEGEKTLTVYDELLIIQSVLDNPSIYLHELQR